MATRAAGTSTMKEKLDALSDKEEAWVASQLESAARFVETFSPRDAGQPLALAALDRAFAAWMASGPADHAESINAVINCVGTAFGRILVEGIGLRWVIATDEHGSDLAVYGLPRTGDVLLYPLNFVAKRWERRETNFLEKSFYMIADQVGTLRRHSQRLDG